MRGNGNINGNNWLIYLNMVTNNKQEFIDELRRKGYKMTGKESVNKVTELILGIHKSQIVKSNGK